AKTGWTKPPELVSNGPFMLTSWRFKRDMRFEQNPHYWNREALNLETISTPSINDPNAAVLAYTSGVVDWVSDVTPAYRADMLADKMAFYQENIEEYTRLKAEGHDMFEIDRRLPDDPRKDIHAVPAFGTYWYNFNCLPTLPDGRRNPFSDARVRRAFAMTVDKQSIVQDVQRLGNPVARTLIPKGSIPGYTSPDGLRCISDAATEEEKQAIVAEARQLLRDAGYATPADVPTIEILFNKDGGHDLIAQVVQKNWQEYLGVSVRLAQKEIKVFRDDLKKQRYMVSRAGWYGDYGDPTTFLDINRIDDGNNDRKYHNPRYEQLLNEAAVELDAERRMALLSEAERISMDEDLPMVPLFHYMTVYLFDPDTLSGLNPHPRTEQNVYLFDVLGDGKGTERVRTMPLLPPLSPTAKLDPRGVETAILDRDDLFALVQLPIIVLVIYTLTLALAWAIPGNPLENPEGRQPKPEVIEAMKRQYNLDSFPNFYWSYLANATGFKYAADTLSGELARERERAEAEGQAPPRRYVFDFGPSLQYEDWTVNEIVRDSLPVSITLGAIAILIALGVGVVAGIAGAVKPNSLVDLGTLMVALIGISLPSFVIGTVLLLIFPVWLGVGEVGSSAGPMDMLLPAITLSLPFAAYIARLTRMGMIDALSTDY
ncbi:Oligopeptide-binding protein OppA (Stage 0 sporulation protein KA), partial [Durusdinium trenchii]